MPQLDGERFIRPGFARDPADDLAFALGHPHEPKEAAEPIVEELERYKAAQFQAWNSPVIQRVRWSLGIALLRSGATVAAALRDRLEAVYARAAKTPDGNKPRQVQQILDVILHGAAGAERSGQRHEGAVQTFDLLHVHDDPGFVLDQVRRHKLDISWRPSARLAFLGGEPVVAHYAEHWRKIRDRAEVHAFVRDFGKMSSPAAAVAVAELREVWS